MKDVVELRATLAKYNQEHLVQFWSELSDEQRRSLLTDLEHIDFAELDEYYKRVAGSLESTSLLFEDSCMQPVPDDLKGSYLNATPDELRMYEKIGLDAISRNEVCALLLAGGQGTRLGVSHPKGMYSVGLRSNKTLYQIQAERLIRLKQLASPDQTRDQNKSQSIPWYIMTSEHTKDLTEQFFASNDYFNLNKENIKLFEQYMLPCLTRDGRVILDEKWKVSKAPDGNGGLYKALHKRGVLADMRSRGIKYIHVYGVDNILVHIADPVFIGFCIHKQANCAAKVVKKTEPDEKVGVICQVNGRFQVVEYSEVSERIRNMRCDNGDLVYSAGNICNHYFNLDFLTMVSEKHENELKHHIAEKKIAYVNEKGERVSPSSTNGIKLEKFVFDVFPFSTNFAIWEVVREEEFSPLKNGLDAKKENALTCKQDLYDLHYKWLQRASAKFDDESSSTSVDYEISPLVSYNGEGLSEIVAGKVLKPGVLIELDQVTNQIKLIEK